MTRQVALLRGINVGKANRISMADLRSLVGSLGYTDVRTHLQSGNVVFDSTDARTATGPAIEAALATEVGLAVSVVVRTAKQLAAVVAADPLAGVVNDPSRYFVNFLGEKPPAPALAALLDLDLDPELLRHDGLHIYQWIPGGALASGVTPARWKSLGVTVTARNWRTVTALRAMATG